MGGGQLITALQHYNIQSLSWVNKYSNIKISMYIDQVSLSIVVIRIGAGALPRGIIKYVDSHTFANTP